MTLTAHELAAVVAWPIGESTIGVQTNQVAMLRSPRSLPVTTDRTWGQATHPEDKRVLGLPIDDALKHLHLLGPTGVGKSSVMLNLISADMTAGRSVIVVDPKGDLVSDVMKRVPQDRSKDVVVIGGSKSGNSVGLNPLALGHRSAADAERTSDAMVAVFKGLFADSWGPRTEDLLHASLMTLTRRKGASLIELPLLLTNDGFRSEVLKGLDEPLVLEPFWSWYESLSLDQRRTIIAPLLNKLRVVLMRPSLRRIVGQASPKFDLRTVFTDNKIVLVSLNRGVLGPEGSSLLGALFVSHLWQVTQERIGTTGDKRKPVMAYLDEFQQYLHLPTDLEDVLAQARSYGLGITLAHQHFHQLPPSMRSAVLSNARSRICFQLGSEDASLLARSTETLTSHDFQGLSAFEVYAQLCLGGQVTPYISARTNPPSNEVRKSGDEICRQSESFYGIANTEIDAAHRSLIGITDSQERSSADRGETNTTVGRRRGGVS
jgi:Type IV secretion-system coupling protein DNA-binding domain/TraM recognition site of TraD and TraG